MWLEIGWLWAALSWKAFFHAIVWVWTCLFFIFESDSSIHIHKGNQLAMWFSVSEKKKKFCEVWKKEKAGAFLIPIATGIRCSYKEEGFWENRTFLLLTRTKMFISFLQYLPLLTSSDWQWANLCNFSLFYTFQKMISPCSQSEENQFRRDKIHRLKYQT